MQQNVPKSWILIFLAVIVLIIGIIVTGPTQDDNSADTTAEKPLEATRATTFNNMLAVGDDAIYLENQPAGVEEVQVGYVKLSRPGYVIIAADDDGVPGKRIGTSVPLEGETEHFTVSLTETLEHDAVYYAVVHHDNGDGVFDVSTDPAANDSLDSVVLMTFLALEGAAPETGAVMP